MAVWQIKNKSGNWVTMPAPAHGGLAIADEPVWSSNTGRGANGVMTGDIVDWKTTIDLTMPPLSFSDAKLLRDTLKEAGAFFKVRYRDFSASAWEEKTVYTANIPRTMYSLANGIRYHTGVKVQLVEK